MNPVPEYGVQPAEWPAGLYTWHNSKGDASASIIVTPEGHALYQPGTGGDWRIWNILLNASYDGWWLIHEL